MSQYSLQSTSLIRGKTRFLYNPYYQDCTSIHFPHPREDLSPFVGNPHRLSLQSTSLIRGKTTRIPTEHTGMTHFNPLPSSEGRQEKKERIAEEDVLQSTSLIRGKTGQVQHIPIEITHFNPLPSSEGRQSGTCYNIHTTILQSTSLIRGKTCKRIIIDA